MRRGSRGYLELEQNSSDEESDHLGGGNEGDKTNRMMASRANKYEDVDKLYAMDDYSSVAMEGGAS